MSQRDIKIHAAPTQAWLHLCFPHTGLAAPGFTQYPGLDIFKIDLQNMTDWASYLASLKGNHRCVGLPECGEDTDSDTARR